MSRVELKPEEAVLVTAHSSALMRHLSNSWHFDAGPTAGSCVVTFEVEFEFRNTLHSSAARVFFHEVHKQLLSAFLKRAEELERKERLH